MSSETGQGLDKVEFLIHGGTFTWVVIRSVGECIRHGSLFAWMIDDVKPER